MLSASRLTAACVLALLGTGSTMAFADPPAFEFGKVPVSVSDIQLIYSRAPDNRATTLLLDNFNLNLLVGKGMPKFDSRSVSFAVPTKGDGTEEDIRADFRANAICLEDATGIILVRVGGATRVIELKAAGADADQSIVETINLKWKSGAEIPIVIFASLERGASAEGACEVTIDGIDFAEAGQPPAPTDPAPPPP
jgi:hypothetical protein